MALVEDPCLSLWGVERRIRVVAQFAFYSFVFPTFQANGEVGGNTIHGQIIVGRSFPIRHNGTTGILPTLKTKRYVNKETSRK